MFLFVPPICWKKKYSSSLPPPSLPLPFPLKYFLPLLVRTQLESESYEDKWCLKAYLLSSHLLLPQLGYGIPLEFGYSSLWQLLSSIPPPQEHREAAERKEMDSTWLTGGAEHISLPWKWCLSLKLIRFQLWRTWSENPKRPLSNLGF